MQKTGCKNDLHNHQNAQSIRHMILNLNP